MISCGKEGRHAGVQRLSQIGLAQVVRRCLGEERLHMLFKGRPHIAEGMDLEARHGKDLRQEVCRIRELELEVRALLGNGLLDKRLGLLHVVVGAQNGPGGNDF